MSADFVNKSIAKLSSEMEYYQHHSISISDRRSSGTERQRLPTEYGDRRAVYSSLLTRGATESELVLELLDMSQPSMLSRYGEKIDECKKKIHHNRVWMFNGWNAAG